MIERKDLYIRDPYVLPYGGKYYLYGTTDEQAWGGKGDGFKVYESSDLWHFEEHVAFSNDDSFWGYEQFWAPEVVKIKDRFYMIAACSSGNNIRRIQIYEADNPLGPFKPKDHTLFKEEFSHLDGTYFFWKGKHYIVYSHEWTECYDGEIMAVEVDDHLEVIGKPRRLFKASEAPWVVLKEKGYVTDGPYLLEHNGEIIMIWSSFASSGYAIGQAKAKDIFGPYEHCERPLIENDGGHGMVFKKDGKLFLSFHRPNFPHLQERPYFCEVEFSDGFLKLKEEHHG